MHEKILRTQDICERLGGISLTTFWRLRKNNNSNFPKSTKIPGTSLNGWHETAVNQWIIENMNKEVG